MGFTYVFDNVNGSGNNTASMQRSYGEKKI